MELINSGTRLMCAPASRYGRKGGLNLATTPLSTARMLAGRGWSGGGMVIPPLHAAGKSTTRNRLRKAAVTNWAIYNRSNGRTIVTSPTITPIGAVVLQRKRRGWRVDLFSTTNSIPHSPLRPLSRCLTMTAALSKARPPFYCTPVSPFEMISMPASSRPRIPTLMPAHETLFRGFVRSGLAISRAMPDSLFFTENTRQRPV